MKHFCLWLYKFVFGRPHLEVGERWVVLLPNQKTEREIVVDMKEGKWVWLREAERMRTLGCFRQIEVVWVKRVELNRGK